MYTSKIKRGHVFARNYMYLFADVFNVGGKLFARDYWRPIVKRGMDISLALTASLLLLPVWLMVALLLRLLEDGPVRFAQVRVGRDGELFECYKFRTMVVDAEKRLKRLLEEDPQAAREWHETQKLKNDPRVTRLGWFLRKTSLDELPQLINVLKGDMSIVGPRPVTPEELQRYGRSARHYLSVRPGLTGLWQVSGRSSTSYRRRVCMDRCYVSKLSLREDCRVILKTVPALMRSGETS